jgi:hypothetical protein
LKCKLVRFVKSLAMIWLRVLFSFGKPPLQLDYSITFALILAGTHNLHVSGSVHVASLYFIQLMGSNMEQLNMNAYVQMHGTLALNYAMHRK